MVTKTARIGALVTTLACAVVGAFIVPTSIFAQQDDQWLAPELHSAASQPACKSDSKQAESITDACQGMDQHGAFNKAKPPSVGARPRVRSGPRPAKSKASSGGGGTVAVLTFFALLGLWSIRGWWVMGRNWRHL